ncbi:MAG: peroxiredoxin [Terriglobia bacterium]
MMRLIVWGMAAFLGLGLSTAKAQELKPGDTAPDFSLTGSDGKQYKLSKLKGKKVVVLAWFPKAFTPGCTIECKSFADNRKIMKETKAAYFMASTDTAEQNKKFAAEHHADYPILSDPGKKVAEAYGVVHEGRQVPERWTFYIGKDGKILFIDKKVNTATAAQDVVAKLKELKAS